MFKTVENMGKLNMAASHLMWKVFIFHIYSPGLKMNQ